MDDNRFRGIATDEDYERGGRGDGGSLPRSARCPQDTPKVANAAAGVARAFAAVAQAGEMEERVLDLEVRAGLRKPA